jgi:hypothetical protein
MVKPISVSDRIGALEESAVRFKDHPIDVPGVALSADLRLLVAQCARDAVHCKACVDTMPREACLRPGTKVYDAVASIQHDDDDSISNEEQLQGVSKNAKATAAIVTIVHSLVNHQGHLDKDWYDDCIQALSKSNILPESVAGAKKQYMFFVSAFAERNHVHHDHVVLRENFVFDDGARCTPISVQRRNQEWKSIRDWPTSS